MRKLWWIIPVVVVAALGYWWYQTRIGSEPSEDMFRRTAVVRRGDLLVSISATGRIDPIEKVDVKSKASGEIIELPIQEGDSIHKGDLIARLDRKIAQNDYDQAKADFGVAEVTVRQREREMKRLVTLYENKLASESELDNSKLAFEEANSQLIRTRSTLSTAEDRLEDTEIRAPIDGVILDRPVEIGQIISSGTTTVTGGTLLCTVANMNRVYVVADVDETDVGKVTTGMHATITPDAFPDRRLQGEVLRVAPLSKVEQNVTVFEVTTLVDNSDGLLKAGMNATVEVITDEARDVLLVPAQAVEYRATTGRTSSGDTAQGGLRAEGQNPQRDTSGARRWEGRQSESATGPQGQRPGPNGGQMAANNGNSRRAGRGGQTPMLQVRKNGAESWIAVRTGLSNVDDIAILDGVAEGDTVVYSLSSGAMQQRAEMMQRMRNNQALPGMSGR